ncbi:CVNH domain protein [Ceratobasidium sp. AG-Ba]|nr:CVNH domain protein [Ceratobasidium sp. AG-Ba]
MSFSRNSRNIHLEGDATLVAECERAGGRGFANSTLNLNTCLGNIDGSFKWGQTDYSLTALNVRLEGTVLKARLQRAESAAEFKESQVNLDDHIENHNGQLRYTP